MEDLAAQRKRKIDDEDSQSFSQDDDISEGKLEEEFDPDQSGLEDDDLLTSMPQAQRLKRSTSFMVLPNEEITRESSKLIQETMQLCSLPTKAAAYTLLRAFKYYLVILTRCRWNKEKLLESYLEQPEKVLDNAGILPFELNVPKLAPNLEPLECLICMETLGPSQVFSLSCLHRYCKDCWKEYLEDGPACIAARCPAPKCKAIVNETAFKMLVDEKFYQKYEYYLARSFVENNDYVKWCPSPGCTYAVRSESAHPKKAVKCIFGCSDSEIGSHSPAPCDQVRKWKKKSKEESENVTWMLQNTKKCPKCRSPIEKNGGCMHMTCRNAACMHEFCWLCRGPWSEHGQATGGYYNCNKFDPQKDKKDYGEKPVDAKTELETYMFYFHRYEAHKNALKIAAEQLAQAQARASQFMDKLGVRSSDTKFLTEATEQLTANRRVLQFSYVMGFFLDKTKEAEKNLFEYLQEDLEKHTNDLSTSYEQGCSRMNHLMYQDFMKWKEELSNKVRVSKKFLTNFLDGVAEGLLADK